MLLASVSTVVREFYVARFPALRAIPQAVGAKPDFILSFADRAVLFARTLFFHFVALIANDGAGHGKPPGKLYLMEAFSGKVDV
jgi:hypothetical protein